MNTNGYFALFIALCSYVSCYAQRSISLPRIFSDHMVLQQQKPINIWGKGRPGDSVYLDMANMQSVAVVHEDGRWLAALPALSASGPYELTIHNTVDTLYYTDVMVGEVWLASGQSNMAFPLAGTLDADLEISKADFPELRLFQVAENMSKNPLDDAEGRWMTCSPNTVGGFSGVAYYFAKQLHQHRGIAVGILHSSWGGTPIEPWISREMMESRTETRAEVLRADERDADPGLLFQHYLEQERQFAVSSKGVDAGVPLLNYDDKAWKKVSAPLSVSAIYGDQTAIYIPGCYVWFRKELDLTSISPNMTLHLSQAQGKIEVFVNGKPLDMIVAPSGGLTGNIPSGVLRKGKNLIAIRLLSMWGSGTVGDAADGIFLSSKKGKRVLEGEWSCHAGIEPRYPDLPRERNNPAALFNAMIDPLIPYTLRGVLWYQGEANTWRPLDYRFLFPMLIQDWRVRWGQGYMPFLFVQLANFGGNALAGADDSWAVLRESQLLTLQQPYTGMAVTIDVGEATDIHPRNKKDVGLRLYEAARYVAYGDSVEYSGPLYQQMEIKGNAIRLSFAHAEQGLAAHGEKLKGFAVAGKDGHFVEAEAWIEGSSVWVRHPDIQDPVHVRYGWAANPTCNLYNKAGLPASPFRTDL